MKIFLSYASEDRASAEEIQLALAGAGHEVFFDRESLPAGGDYHERIRASVDACDLFVFLISPDAVGSGGYTLTEMGYARTRWPHPKGHVLPVVLRPTAFATIPAYLKSVTLLEPKGNAPAETADAVARLATQTGSSPTRPAGAGWPKVAAAAAVLGVAAGGAWWLWPRDVDKAAAGQEAATGGPQAAVPNPVQLRFSYQPLGNAQVSLDDTLRVNMKTARHVVDGERLAQQPSGYYSYNTAYPGSSEQLEGTLAREIRQSSLLEAPGAARFCLKRPAALEPSNDQHVHLDCPENDACKLHFPSPKWLELCPVAAPKTTRHFGLMSVAHAADLTRRWSVPSAKTLAAHAGDLKGVGYTLFSLETDAFHDPAVIGVEVDLRVNGVAILEDGLAPALRPVPNDPAKPFRHSFALESLDFEGAQAGCEAIVLTLRPVPALGKAAPAPVSATLPYVALRDAAAQSVALGKGTLTWSARYIVPADEWSHEAFITSVSYAAALGESAAASARQRAVQLKRDFDRLALSFQGRPLVAVIRPPLTLSGDRLAYGVTTGVLQASGQVRFTFSAQEANAIGDALVAARAANPAAKRVIDAQKYIYKVAGTRERRETPTPPGVCSHVSAQ